MAEKAQGYTTHGQVQRDCFAEVKITASSEREMRHSRPSHVVSSFIGLPHMNLKAENVCFYQERVDSRNHSFFLHLNGSLLVSSYSPIYTVPQSEEAKSKSTVTSKRHTRFPLRSAGRALK